MTRILMNRWFQPFAAKERIGQRYDNRGDRAGRQIEVLRNGD